MLRLLKKPLKTPKPSRKRMIEKPALKKETPAKSKIQMQPRKKKVIPRLTLSKK